MTRQLSVSSVTQTWLVSRRHGKDHKNLRDPDGDEQTVTICRPSVVLLIRSSIGNSSEHLNLSFGIHRFVLDGTGDLRKQNHLEGRADFEIDVNSAGAFFFSLSEGEPIRVNGRQVGWIRLRSDDVVEIGNWTLSIDPGPVLAEDRTVLVRTVRAPHKVQERVRKGLRRWSGLAILLFGFPAMLAIALAFGYMLARNDMRDAAAVQGDLPSVAREEMSLQNPETEIRQTRDMRAEQSLPAFGKREFESVVAQFRSGETHTACENLKNAMSSADKGVWRSKGLLLLKRRCGDG